MFLGALDRSNWFVFFMHFLFLLILLLGVDIDVDDPAFLLRTG